VRILVLSSEYRETGSSMRGFYLSRALERLGHRASFLTTGVHRPLRLDRAVSLLRWMPRDYSGYDAIVCVKPYPNSVLPAFLASRRHGCLSVVDVDDLDSAYREGFLSMIAETIQSPMPHMADLVTCHNQRLREYLEGRIGFPRERTLWLEQGVDPEAFRFPTDPAARRRVEKMRKEHPKLVVNVGHFDVAADLEPLLTSFSLARRIDPEMEFLMVGDGPLLNHYRRMARDLGLGEAIRFEGSLPPWSVAERLLWANTCTIYYRNRRANEYRSSMKLREYLWMGRKVLSTNVGELRSFSKYVYLTRPSYEEYAESLVRVVEEEGSRRARRGMRYARHRFSWNEIAAVFSEALDDFSRS